MLSDTYQVPIYQWLIRYISGIITHQIPDLSHTKICLKIINYWSPRYLNYLSQICHQNYIGHRYVYDFKFIYEKKKFYAKIQNQNVTLTNNIKYLY
jgi:hypothetical protein